MGNKKKLKNCKTLKNFKSKKKDYESNNDDCDNNKNILYNKNDSNSHNCCYIYKFIINDVNESEENFFKKLNDEEKNY